MNKAERRNLKIAGSHWESNPGLLTSSTSALTTELQQPDNCQPDNRQHDTINYVHYTSRFSHAPGSHYICAIRIPLGVNRKHYTHFTFLFQPYLAFILE